MAKIIAKLKTKEDFINKYSNDYFGLENDIILSDLSKRNGFVKGIADYGYIKNFGIVRIPFQYAYNDERHFEDWTYEDGEKIPHEIYIWETIKILDANKLLNK